MKKRTCVILAFLFPFFAFSQGVKASIYDKFLKQQRIEMAPVSIAGLADKTTLSVAFSAVGPTLYLTLSGSGWGAFTIDKGNELVLRFANNSTLTLRAAALQSFEPGVQQNAYRHQYFLRFQDLELLRHYDLAGLRKYSFDTYSDLSLPNENAIEIRNLSTLFFTELKKANITATAKQIRVRDIRSHVGDSVRFCSKVYRTRYFQESDEGPTLLDIQADFSDPFVNVVILEKDRAKFANAPEKIYLNKDVCISGVVGLRNNIPYLIVQNREQVKINGSVSLAEVGAFEGDSVTVSGPVSSVRTVLVGGARQVHLSLGAPYPDQELTVRIQTPDNRNLDLSGASYAHQQIRVRGRVNRQEGKPFVVVQHSHQLEVLAGPESALFAAAAEGEGTDGTAGSNTGTDGKVKETLAEFPGGAAAFAAYLQKNLVVPATVRAGGPKKIIASFEIDAQGLCRNIRIVESAGKIADEEIKKLLLNMPKWQPAFSNGRFIATHIVYPFIL